ncbi:MAG: VanW family protein [Candidatus Limnocylindria bacterium]
MTVATDRLHLFPSAFANLRWSAVLAGFASTTVVLGVAVVGGATALAATYDGRVMPGVEIGGAEVAGLDRAAADDAVRAALPSLSSGSVTLVAGDEERSVPYAAFERDYRIDAMLDDAFAVGRRGNFLERAVAFMRSGIHSAHVSVAATYDPEALDRLVTSAAADLVRQPRDAVATLSGGTFEVEAGVSGRRIDAPTSVVAVAAALASTDPGDVTVRLVARDVEPSVTTEEAEFAAAHAIAMTAHDLTLTAGDDEFTIGAASLRPWVEFVTTAGGGYRARLLTDPIVERLRALAADIDRQPQDASFYSDGAQLSVIPSVEGRTLDVEASVRRVVETLEALRTGASAPTVELSIATAQPALTTEQAEAAVPQMQVISSWTTYFTPNPGDFFGENIAVPTRILDGYVVVPGAWFDFWTAVGPVTPERGYGPGGAIINGRSVSTGALGGGICSTSTTLFNAALRAGLEIGARTNHYYYISRYPTGLDATVYMDDTSVVTMSFRNDTPYPIIIRGYNDYGVVRFDLLSVPTGRTVFFTDPIIRNQRAAKDVIEYTDELEPGVQERVEFPHDGMQVWVTRTVTDAGGAVIHQEEYFSDYRVVNGIIRQGTPEETPSPTPSASPSPSPSP